MVASTTATGTGGEKIYCGPSDDPFFVDLGGIFDLGQTRAGGTGDNAPSDGVACKNIHEKQDRNAIVIYRWSLKADSADRLSRLLVPVINIRGENPWTSLQISDITVDPSTGNYVLVASKERALIAITPTGEPVFARALPQHHEQPEGIAVTKDHVLIVSDEAVKASASITLYRLP